MKGVACSPRLRQDSCYFLEKFGGSLPWKRLPRARSQLTVERPIYDLLARSLSSLVSIPERRTGKKEEDGGNSPSSETFLLLAKRRAMAPRDCLRAGEAPLCFSGVAMDNFLLTRGRSQTKECTRETAEATSRKDLTWERVAFRVER